ncbi:MAG: ribbon-helix-helix domain-containing protein [Spirochaetota bacterium]
MVRTQIQLTEEQARQLKLLSAQRGVPLAELVRQGIDRLLKESSIADPRERKRKAREAVGRFRSGKSDVSLHHDRYLDEAYSG